jgi:hypothetical protein
MTLSTHRRLSPLATAVAASLTISAAFFASPARAGDQNEDATIGAYRLRAEECARHPDTFGCMSFGGASPTVAAQRPAPSPSRAAVPARLRHARHPARQ